jgi:hypothetical protein
MMRPLRLAAVRTEIDLRQRDTVRGTALVAAGFRGFSLRDGHERLPTIASSASCQRHLAGRSERFEKSPVV